MSDVHFIVPVGEGGDEILIPFRDVRCHNKVDCGGAKLIVKPHDNNPKLYWRCPKCGGYYGEAGNAPYPFCSHKAKCIEAGRCERTVHGERYSCAD